MTCRQQINGFTRTVSKRCGECRGSGQVDYSLYPHWNPDYGPCWRCLGCGTVDTEEEIADATE
jgi:DnaJ-class molecular chaperone